MGRHSPDFKIRVAKSYLAGGIGHKALAALFIEAILRARDLGA